MRTHVVQMLREAKMNLAAAGCARSITPEEALRILETMDQECQHAEPLQGSVAEALNLNLNQAPSTDGHCRADCRAARAGAKASPVRATCRGGAAARTEPAKGGLGDAVLVELRNQQTPLAEKRARNVVTGASTIVPYVDLFASGFSCTSRTKMSRRGPRGVWHPGQCPQIARLCGRLNPTGLRAVTIYHPLRGQE